MRFRITVRKITGIELRGYIDVESVEDMAAFSAAMEPFGMVIASPVSPNYDPFAISQPEHPPTIEKSREIVDGLAESLDPSDFMDYIAEIHYNQALVIRGERKRADDAEAELRDRELHHFETEAILAKVKELTKPPHTGDTSQAIWNVVRNV